MIIAYGRRVERSQFLYIFLLMFLYSLNTLNRN